ncbi:IscS subfamily cysteine desulfurase [Paenibacillus alvei]|uniref:IscS subfamily cysteine desulfurase n=1 Tax=Paenibacillus alvei TaxID=44250 RepID=A0AAP6ZWP0_PAEAL|nr:IscS subfamily cysteine desulfurase [Paenibacillus alvei]NEZ40682.1 aminotransferase class V-fold PLP-dependent enzyme [Paenibacillus alvei]NOJ69522.1 IscS subfamily cysteine desulfurase [Paenibacillus alvei]
MIYLDYAAAAPMDERAIRMLNELNREVYGNSSSLHDAGGHAAYILEYCREKLANMIGGVTEGVYFTSGGSESNLLSLQSILNGLPDCKKHLITTTMEHASIRNAIPYLEQLGYRVTLIEPNERGIITKEILEASLESDTGLVSIQHANSETGIVQPLAELSPLLSTRGIFLHSDMVQTFGKLPIDIRKLGVDACSLSSHKVHGPKGVGAAYLHPHVPWQPILPGTSHERGFRAGTVNVPGIGAFITAAELCVEELAQRTAHFRSLRSYLFTQAEHLHIPLVCVMSEKNVDIVPHIAGCLFDGMEGQYVMLECNRIGICISTGTACTAGHHEHSPSLAAIGLSKEDALRFIRISFGRSTTIEHLDRMLTLLASLKGAKPIGE